jgi:hypothetical protein
MRKGSSTSMFDGEIRPGFPLYVLNVLVLLNVHLQRWSIAKCIQFPIVYIPERFVFDDSFILKHF